MGKIGQNTKIQQPYVVQKTLTGLGTSSTLGLQRAVNIISLQCIPWPVACSEWGACLTDFRFQWCLKWKLLKTLIGFMEGDTELGFMAKFGENRPLRSCRKVAWINTQTRPSLHFAQNGSIAPKIPWTLSKNQSFRNKSGKTQPIQTKFSIRRIYIYAYVRVRGIC